MKKYILFGAGKYGKMLLELFSNDQVTYFCDNYLAGITIYGKQVISFDELQNIYQYYSVVLAIQKRKCYIYSYTIV